VQANDAERLAIDLPRQKGNCLWKAIFLRDQLKAERKLDRPRQVIEVELKALCLALLRAHMDYSASQVEITARNIRQSISLHGG
jgi:hypothetical protein